MFYEKRYGLILDNPNINKYNAVKLIEAVYANNLIPIIFITDSKSNGNYLNYANKIEIYRNKFPKLREDNFIIMDEYYRLNNANYKWKKELKQKISTINVNAFGTTVIGVNDKMFITNIDKHLLVDKDVLLLTNKLDLVLTDLVNIADICNIKTLNDNKFFDYFSFLFKNRNKDEIYYDENAGLSFESKIKSIQSNKAYFYLLDEEYVSLIEKYNLGKLLFSNTKKSIKVDDKDLNNVLKILNTNNIKYSFDSNTTRVIKNVNETIIMVGET